MKIDESLQSKKPCSPNNTIWMIFVLIDGKENLYSASCAVCSMHITITDTCLRITSNPSTILPVDCMIICQLICSKNVMKFVRNSNTSNLFLFGIRVTFVTEWTLHVHDCMSVCGIFGSCSKMFYGTVKYGIKSWKVTDQIGSLKLKFSWNVISGSFRKKLTRKAGFHYIPSRTFDVVKITRIRRQFYKCSSKVLISDKSFVYFVLTYLHMKCVNFANFEIIPTNLLKIEGRTPCRYFFHRMWKEKHAEIFFHQN